MFEQQYKRANDRIHPRKDLLKEMEAKWAEEQAHQEEEESKVVAFPAWAKYVGMAAGVLLCVGLGMGSVLLYSRSRGMQSKSASPERPSFDYNGFVRFVGLPMSHPLPDGSLWSPSSDPLEEDDLWRLVGNGEYTMTELLDYVCMEIYARRGYTFPNEDQAAYRQHFEACDWYRATEDAPERFMTATERENLNLVRRLKDLLES